MSLWHVVHVGFCLVLVFVLYGINSLFHTQDPSKGLTFFAFSANFIVLYLLGLPVIYFARKNLTSRKDHARSVLQDKSDILGALFELLEKKSSRSAHQGKRVASLTRSLCEILEVPRKETEVIVFAALYHDLGKLVVSGAEGEAAVDAQGWKSNADAHAEAGEHVLKHVHYYPGADLIVRHHHERWNGSGLPEGLSGNSIPLGSRIIGVVDAFDELTHSVVSDTSTPDREALARIKAESGRLFDPAVVAGLETLVERKAGAV